MIRSQIYLSEQQRAQLTQLSILRGESMSELCREAIDHYLTQEGHKRQDREYRREMVFGNAFGMWEDNRTDFAAIRGSADRE